MFDSGVGLNSTTEKGLLIDLSILKQSYEIRELTETVWIPSAQSPADAMAKKCLKRVPELTEYEQGGSRYKSLDWSPFVISAKA